MAIKKLYWERMKFFQKMLKLNKTEFSEKIKPMIGYNKKDAYSKFEKEGIDLEKAVKFAQSFSITKDVFTSQNQSFFERRVLRAIIEHYQVKGQNAGFGVSGLKEHRNILKSLNGYWLEVIGDPKNHNYSIGRFSSKSQNFKYNGVSYNTKGVPGYSWNTVSMHFERDVEGIYYIYKLLKIGLMHNVQYGFGFLKTEFSEYHKTWGLFGGYYLNAEENTSPKNMIMFRLDTLADKLKKAGKYDLSGNSPEDHRAFIQYLITNTSDFLYL